MKLAKNVFPNELYDEFETGYVDLKLIKKRNPANTVEVTILTCSS